MKLVLFIGSDTYTDGSLFKLHLHSDYQTRCYLKNKKYAEGTLLLQFVMGYSINLEKATLQNTHFREVLHTTKQLQLVVMCLKSGEDVGMEVHKKEDQLVRLQAGYGLASVGHEVIELSPGMCVMIPAGTAHNIVNTGTEDLKFYSIYTPHHSPRAVHITKADALAEQDDEDDYS